MLEKFKEQYRIDLDPEQSRACEAVDGKNLLLAVPGSGKTTVMISRIGYMVNALNIPPSEILAITYSVAGTREMKSRYEKLFSPCGVEFRTIHGFCATLINRYERLRNREAFALMEKENEATAVLKRIVAEIGTYPSENELKDIQIAISYCKNCMMKEDEIKKEIVIDGRDFLQIYKSYEEYKLKNRIMDYDDQLIYGYKILKTCPDVNSIYTDRFKYICVDEAQDTSKIQHEIIKLLVDRCSNLFMVGDDDQSIYGFRAAYPQALIDFKSTYPESNIMTLSKNYRSTQSIVKLSSEFIKKNAQRALSQKKMITDNPEGEMPVIIRLNDLEILPDYLRRAVYMYGDGTLAFLFRLNESMLPVIDLFDKKEIEYKVRGNDGLFFTHPVVSDVISIMSFAQNPYDSELFSKLYYKLGLSLTKYEAQKILNACVGEKRLSIPDYIASAPYLNEFKRKKAQRLSEYLYRINMSDAFEAMKIIFFLSGYGKHYESKTNDNSKRNVLLSLSRRYVNKAEFIKRLNELRDRIKRGSVSDSGTAFTTIHSAKGLEYDTVIICDCQNGILPSQTTPFKDMTDKERAEYEEDRRLFYVGATRAKRRLIFLTWDKEFGHECEGFDFVDEFFGKNKKVNLSELFSSDNDNNKTNKKYIMRVQYE